jgi:hypothetical protein
MKYRSIDIPWGLDENIYLDLDVFGTLTFGGIDYKIIGNAHAKIMNISDSDIIDLGLIR